MMRNVLVMLEVDDERAFDEDIGPIEYLEREFQRLAMSSIFLTDARILDDDDEYDAKAIELADKIFNDVEEL